MSVINISVTLADAIKIAVEDRDAAVAGRVADTLRALGWTYKKILARVQELHPEVTAADWDDLMMEADRLASKS